MFCCVQIPMTESEWLKISDDFFKKWQFPHCIGAMDGKHIAIQAPPNSGSLYYNYKHFFSVVLLAVVDANYRFIYVDVGNYGRNADGGVFSNSSLAEALAANYVNIPSADNSIDGIKNLPYTLVADDAFPLKQYIMKPYALRGLTAEQRIFNYRLSRARRVVENAFGIISNRFRIFTRAIAVPPHRVDKITMAACCLHNFLMRDQTTSANYVADLLDTDSHQPTCTMQHVSKQGCNRASNQACAMRDKLCAYFNSEHMVQSVGHLCTNGTITSVAC